MAEKLKPIGGAKGGGDNIDKDIINNLEGQINLLKKVLIFEKSKKFNVINFKRNIS